MASIQTSIQLIDKMTSPLQRINSTLSSVIDELERVESVSGDAFDASSFNTARANIEKATNELSQMEDKLDDIPSAQKTVESGFSGWQKAIMVANNAVDLIKSTLGNLGLTDVSGAFDRIDTMNQFDKTITTMTGDAEQADAALAKIKDTVTGTAYGLDVASAATQGFVTRGMSLGAATEQVRVWADAVSFYGEGTNEQLENVVDAIGKMYSKGTVESEQLDRLFDAGIGAAEIYADAVGRSVSDVKDDLSSGAISSAEFLQTITEAMDSGVSAGAAQSGSDSWSTTFANLQAAATRGWQSVIESIDEALASHGLPSAMELVQNFGQVVENLLNKVAGAANTIVGWGINLYNMIGSITNFISENWAVIEPILSGLLTLVGLYIAGMVVWKTVTMLAAVASGFKAAMDALMHGSLIGAAKAQKTYNKALLQCPITWIIIAIVALIAIILAVCNAIAKMTGVADSGFGMIAGGVFVVGAFFKNLGLTVANVALGIWNVMKGVAYNIYVVFYNKIQEVKTIFYGLLAVVASVVAMIAEALNALPFIEFDYSGISNTASEYAQKALDSHNSKKEYKNLGDEFSSGMSTFDTFESGWASDAYKSGSEWGDGVASKVSGLFSFDTDSTDVDSLISDYEDILGDTTLTTDLTDSAESTAANTESTAASAAEISDKLDITSSQLKYIREYAEKEAINRFTTASINVSMTNNNNVSSDADLDGIMNSLKNGIEQQMNIVAEGA